MVFQTSKIIPPETAVLCTKYVLIIALGRMGSLNPLNIWMETGEYMKSTLTYISTNQLFKKTMINFVNLFQFLQNVTYC